jgi:hypothetical protein
MHVVADAALGGMCFMTTALWSAKMCFFGGVTLHCLLAADMQCTQHWNRIPHVAA